MIPFNKPFIVGKELFYISQAVVKGKLAGDGYFTKRCHEWFESKFGANHVLLTHSCTAALEMAALLCDVQPGDEVIMPSFTFVSTANAFALRGAKPVFVDIREDTLNIDETKIDAAITEKTKAIVPVHYAGVACEMDSILKTASKHRIPVIEDAAQAVNALYKDKYLGTLGTLGCYSFHETKNCISGEGGALVINEKDGPLFERAEIIREKGTDRSRFFRGEVDKYAWVDFGSSYLPSEMIAAFLYAQLEESEKITKTRRRVYDYYEEHLAPLAKEGLLRLPAKPENSTHNGHMFYVLVNELETRERLIAHMAEQGVNAVFHYVPLHSSPMGKTFGYEEGDFPLTENLSGRLIRLPCYFELTEKEQAKIVKSVFSFFSSVY